MTPRKPRAANKSQEAKSAVVPPSAAAEPRPSRSRKGKPKAAEEVVEDAVEEVIEKGDEAPPGDSDEAAKDDADDATAEDGVQEHDSAVAEESATEAADEDEVEGGAGGEETAPPGEASGSGTGPKLSTAERMAKLKELRVKMNQTTLANRRDLVEDHQKSRVTAKELQRLEKQRKLAQTLRLKAEAEDTGEDLERRKAWEWSIEQNERWEEKMEGQRQRADTNFHNAEDDAHKKYNRNLKSTKPDLVAYERAKEAALGLAPGTLVPAGTTSAQLATSSRHKGLTAAEDLYRGADTLAYGDNKPSEDAIDRVIGKINKDIDKGKRKKKDDDDGEVTYINDRNKVFNKKIARYFDKYTKEIRANFERGTAL